MGVSIHHLPSIIGCCQGHEPLGTSGSSRLNGFWWPESALGKETQALVTGSHWVGSRGVQSIFK